MDYEQIVVYTHQQAQNLIALIEKRGPQVVSVLLQTNHRPGTHSKHRTVLSTENTVFINGRYVLSYHADNKTVLLEYRLDE